MEVIALFVLYVGAFMTGILIMLFLYFIFCLARKVIKLIIQYFRANRSKKKNKNTKKFIRNIIAIRFRSEMRELREPQVYKEEYKYEVQRMRQRLEWSK